MVFSLISMGTIGASTLRRPRRLQLPCFGGCGIAAYVAAPLIVLTLLTVAGCEKAEPEPMVRPVRTIQVGESLGTTRRVFPGRAKATEEVDLAFRVAGPLIERPADVGLQVKQDDLLARIDPRDFRIRIQSVEGELIAARAALRQAKIEYERLLELYERDAATDLEIERAAAARDKFIGQIQTLEASLDTAKSQLEDTYLRAPFDAVVATTYVENFQAVQVNEPVVRLLDISRIEMVIDVPEQYISLIPNTAVVLCTFDAFPDRELEARIKSIGTEASTTTRTYPVTLIMNQPQDIKILPGMAGIASGKQNDRPVPVADNQFEVPLSAILTDNGKQYVWVIDDDTMTVKRQPVQPGATTAYGIRVSGLTRGQRIAIAGVHYLNEGQRVRLLQNVAATAEGTL